MVSQHNYNVVLKKKQGRQRWGHKGHSGFGSRARDPGRGQIIFTGENLILKALHRYRLPSDTPFVLLYFGDTFLSLYFGRHLNAFAY